MGERTDGPRELADRNRLARAAKTLDVARDLRIPEGQLQTQRDRFGVNAVRSPDHGCLAMFEGAISHGGSQLVEILEKQVAGLLHLEGLSGVDHIRGGQTEWEPAP